MNKSIAVIAASMFAASAFAASHAADPAPGSSPLSKERIKAEGRLAKANVKSDFHALKASIKHKLKK
jgi:Spy/CpxP family protein refolding chaperone